MAHETPRFVEATGPSRLDVLGFAQAKHFAPDDPGEPRPVDQTDGQDSGGQARTQRSGEDDRQEDERETPRELDDAADETVDPATAVPGDGAGGGADDHRD